MALRRFCAVAAAKATESTSAGRQGLGWAGDVPAAQVAGGENCFFLAFS